MFITLKNKSNIFLINILIISLFLRILSIHFYLPLINQDELSNLYDAISLKETGNDRWCSPSVLVFRGFGNVDYRPPLFIWGTMLLSYFYENEYIVRYISLLFGMLNIVIVWRISKILFNSEIIIKTILFTYALMPITIITSGIGFESATMSSFFSMFAILLFLKFEKKEKIIYLILSGLVFGIATSVYQSCKLTSFLFVLTIALKLLYEKKHKTNVFFLFSSLIGASPQIILLLEYPDLFFARSNSLVNLKENNFFSYILNIILSFDIYNMFLDYKNSHNLINIRLTLIQLPLYVFGVFNFYKSQIYNNKNYRYYIIIIILVSIMPDVLSKSSINYYRNNLIAFYTSIFISIGYYIFLKKRIFFQLVKHSFIIFFSVFLITIIIQYNNINRYKDFNNDCVLSSKKLYEITKKRPQTSFIFIENFGNQFYIYILYYLKIKPSVFQKSFIKKSYKKDGFDNIEQIDNIYFKDLSFFKTPSIYKNSIYVSYHKILTNDKIKLIDSISNNNIDNVFFYVTN